MLYSTSAESLNQPPCIQVDYARAQGYMWEAATQGYMRVCRVMHMKLPWEYIGLQGTTQSYTVMLTWNNTLPHEATHCFMTLHIDMWD